MKTSDIKRDFTRLMRANGARQVPNEEEGKNHPNDPIGIETKNGYLIFSAVQSNGKRTLIYRS